MGETVKLTVVTDLADESCSAIFLQIIVDLHCQNNFKLISFDLLHQISLYFIIQIEDTTNSLQGAGLACYNFVLLSDSFWSCKNN